MSERTPNLGLFKYNVIEDGKQPFSIEKALNDNWDILDKCSGGLEIGDIGVALYVDETQGKRRRLNGSILAINENTQAFVDFLKGLQVTSPSLFVNEETWQTEKTMSKLGQCGKFVLNETAGTVRLPKVVNINGLQDLTQSGVKLNERLPNITGSFGVRNLGGAGLCDYAGAFYASYTANYAATSSSSTQTGNARLDASRSSSTYQNNAPVQQEAIQYQYFIQIASSTQTNIDIHNEIQLNNPFSLFDCKYTDHKLENVSWLLSQGQWNDGGVYTDAYNRLVYLYSNPVDGFSVKRDNEEYGDYDFVIKGNTFRLPLKSKIASGKAVVGNGMALGLWNGVDGSALIEYPQQGLTLDKGKYGSKINTPATPAGHGVTATLGITTDSSKSGIETDSTGLYLYYYVGETIQNAHLIDAGRIQENMATKDYALTAGFPSGRYINLTLGATQSQYIAPANGWFSFAKLTGSTSNFNCLQNATKQYKVSTAGSNTNLGVFLPVAKGDLVTVWYNSTGETQWFRFYYAEGEQ